jgi:hypothetical protein
MEEYTNKKLIISLIVASAVIGGAIYIYRKYNEPKNTN